MRLFRKFLCWMTKHDPVLVESYDQATSTRFHGDPCHTVVSRTVETLTKGKFHCKRCGVKYLGEELHIEWKL